MQSTRSFLRSGETMQKIQLICELFRRQSGLGQVPSYFYVTERYERGNP